MDLKQNTGRIASFFAEIKILREFTSCYVRRKSDESKNNWKVLAVTITRSKNLDPSPEGASFQGRETHRVLLIGVSSKYPLCGCNYSDANLLESPAKNKRIESGIQEHNKTWKFVERLLWLVSTCCCYDRIHNNIWEITKHKQAINNKKVR